MSAAVMPMRRVPCAKAGIAVAAKSPRLAAATRTRLNIHGSTVRRLPGGDAGPGSCKGQAKATAACGLHACEPGGWDGIVEKATGARRIPCAGGAYRIAADVGGCRASAPGLCRIAGPDGSHPQALGL